MIKINVANGYYLVDSWDDVFTLQVATALPDENLHSLMNFRIDELLKEGKLDDMGWVFDDYDTDGAIRKMKRIWVHTSKSRFIPKY